MSLKPPRGTAARPGSKSGLDIFEYELVQEKAAALARMGRRLQAALDALAAFDAARAERPSPGTPEADARADLVADAGEALWYYVIQREVCGFRDSEAMMRELRVPRDVRLRMGYRPRKSPQPPAPR
jgi:hypothetical protein